ncbi:cobalt transport domain protein [Streptococcus constellatus subsp. pharyngis SK1060 = CCUG 46377]|uniref:Cobalt transport domain protein n=1 Tax=Streptococcus constellatus subsp. pharyngis SK1060 = CCUG 46377 TaxID=1035184 RepID=F9P9H7_STRCV|nr:cobalt transport domain protein [Streptococcus constellatus subsp. pharyngis SK1060 = CCUG 46377]KXU00848.1 Transmembrane component of general energizing module of ECF transporter [Streptococcus constellatus]
MDSMILGRYVSGNSIIHRLDPRSKLLSMFFFILIIFLANNIVTNGLLFIFAILLVGLSKIPLVFSLKD